MSCVVGGGGVQCEIAVCHVLWGVLCETAVCHVLWGGGERSVLDSCMSCVVGGSL